MVNGGAGPLFSQLYESCLRRLQEKFELNYANIPEESAAPFGDGGAFNFDDSYSDASAEESSDGEDSEAERESKLGELSNQVGGRSEVGR